MRLASFTHRVVLHMALMLALATVPPAWARATGAPLEPSASATRLLKECGQYEQLMSQAQQGAEHAGQALQRAKKTLQLSMESHDAEAADVAREAVATAEAALVKARNQLALYQKRRDAAMEALGRTGRRAGSVSVSGIRGEVYMHTRAGLARIDPSFKLQEGDVLVTGNDSVAAFSLDDGSRMEVGANTEFRTQKLAGNDISLELITGRIQSSIKKLGEKGRYVIQTAGATIAVRGTEFFTQVLDGLTTIRVQRGEVEVTARKGDAHAVVREGQRMTVHEDGTLQEPSPDPADGVPSV